MQRAVSMPPLRVLFVDPVGEKGGAEVFLLGLVKRLDPTRFRPAVVCLRPGPFVDELTSQGVATTVIATTRVRDVANFALTVSRISQLIAREKIDVLVSNGGKPHYYGALAATLCRIPEVWCLHDPPDMRTVFTRLSTLLATSHIAAGSAPTVTLASAGALRTRACTLLDYGIDVAGYREQLATVPPLDRRSLGVPDNAPLIVQVGRLQPHKGQAHLVAAAQQVIRVFPDVRFLLIGGSLFGRDPDFPDQLRRDIAWRGLQRHVVLAGFLTDDQVVSAVAEATLVAHPALSEPFGLALLEAMAARKPIVASAVDGPKRIVDHGTTGLLVPPGEPPALADALIALLGDPDRRSRMGAAALRRVEARFDLQRTVDQMQMLLLLAGTHGVPHRQSVA
jgi:glycosyltransferase involved in cell wall biosynthesis